ncbi:Mur ligase family protein [Acetomicrobium sp.]|uniref:Mur ligase family protein n=1 Tax=Acetomicrobium sp. TaxID=1872099 RepID=UPI0028720508|nr:Mur ligase family protein [Acetomicrobium sp.]MDR9769968.1 Mur ligase family protein [Acetomicrobium sp.]
MLVTGTRGKSSLVRLITAGFRARDISCFSRITGVIPTELSPRGLRRIIRSREGHIKELQWWLSQIPQEAEAIVAENSAVAVEVQPLAARWLKPNLVVWTNLREDHFEAWGPTKEEARIALFAGVPKGVPVVLGPGLEEDGALLELLKKNHNEVYFTKEKVLNFEDANIALAMRSLNLFGLNVSEDMLDHYLEDDPGRFRILKMNNGVLAFGFSVNDLESTVSLFSSLKWDENNTSVLFNNRRDRPGRLKAFEPWLKNKQWRGVYICGAHPLRLIKNTRWVCFKDINDIVSFVNKRGLVFGCGNIAGLPLQELIAYEEVDHNCDKI